MEKSTIHQLAWSSSHQVSELAAGESTVMLDLTREMTGIDHTPLITTKLHIPRPRAQLVSRSQLAERLQQGMTDALTLVSFLFFCLFACLIVVFTIYAIVPLRSCSVSGSTRRYTGSKNSDTKRALRKIQ
jgi:hypothetical protein